MFFWYISTEFQSFHYNEDDFEIEGTSEFAVRQLWKLRLLLIPKEVCSRKEKGPHGGCSS